jgi:drug/metabolite transporter (DMT)-like permease
MWALSLRLALSMVLLGAVLLVTRTAFPKGRALKYAIGYGIFDFAVSLPLLYWGETSVPSGLAAVLYSTAPIWSMLMERAFGMEKIDLRRLGAALVALGGVGIIFWREIAFGQSPLAILSIIAAVITGTFSVILLRKGPQQSSIGANFAGTLVAVPICAAISFLAREPHPLPAALSPWIPVVYLAVVGSIAFLIFAWLINQWKVSSAAFVAVIIPIIAVILGSLVRHEKFAPGSLVGAAIVLVATAFVIGAEARKPHAAPPEVASPSGR